MNHWQLKTAEERSLIAKKAHATRKANKQKINAARDEVAIYANNVREQIACLETKLSQLHIFERMNAVSAVLTNKYLLDSNDIVKVALPWKRACGVYFLILDGVVVYVGQSANIYSRICQHTDKHFDKYAYVPCEVELLDKLESLYIHLLKPKLNGNNNPNEKAAPINLRKLLNMV
jgi:hypothetical protein